MKKLYRYNINHRLDKHEIGPTCKPVKIDGKYVCKHGDWPITYDFYGFETKRGAIKEEVTRLRLDIEEKQKLIRKLMKKY